MKLQQLTYIVEVARCDLNVSRAAQKLHTSQPGVSKQIRMLEDELEVEIFRRKGKQLTAITRSGEEILRLARDIIGRANDIKAMASDQTHPGQGKLKIATTHTQARYALPKAIAAFSSRHPRIELEIYQGTPDQLAELARKEAVDVVIATEALELFSELVLLPCYYWNRCILTPGDHELVSITPLTLADIARFPLVTYVFATGGHQLLEQTFGAQGLVPRVALSAVDTDVIKTYVRLGMGVGIIAAMAYDPKLDADLVALDAGHLFADSLTMIGLRPDRYPREYLYDFVQEFAPHLRRDLVAELVQHQDWRELANAIGKEHLPRR